MTEQLPYSDLFPYLHPLGTMPDTVDVPIEVKVYFNKHYNFILPAGYLNPEKLQKALEYLNAHHPGDTIYKKAADFLDSIPYEDIYRVPDHDETGVSYFWVYTVSAFLFLNLYQNDKSPNITERIRQSFERARTHKTMWLATYGQRMGGAGRATKYKIAKEKAYRKLKTFSTALRRKKAYAAAFELLKDTELFSGLEKPPTINTLERWIREWKREEKNIVC